MKNEMTTSEGEVVSLDPHGCKAFTPGHQWHLIQVTHSWDDEGRLYQPCEVTACSTDGWLTVHVDGESDTRSLWTHDPDRGRSFVDGADPQINLGYSLLRNAEGNYLCFAKEISSCVVGATSGSLFDQLLSHGGFTVSGPEALRQALEDETNSSTQ
ncbi:MAG: hypothetical protein WCJ88_11190 [Actinomycetes bacterium]